MKNIFKNIKNWNSSMKLGTAIALGGVILVGTSVIYASNKTPTSSSSSDDIIQQSTNVPTTTPIVNEKVEELIRPYNVDCEIAHYFYDETDTPEIREKAIVGVPGANRTYMLSEGCDYTYNNNVFSVVACVSGTISDKISDPTFGEIVILTHESGTKFIYASLSIVQVNKGQEVKQGDILASSGSSLYTSELGSSLHFEIIRDGKHLNPERMYSTSVNNL